MVVITKLILTVLSLAGGQRHHDHAHIGMDVHVYGESRVTPGHCWL